ncbi:MAG: hypothetical protein KAX37_07195 [Opitutaceae bacterium]|nr:hypothetical protein [Opitutaceae bacterium]
MPKAHKHSLTVFSNSKVVDASDEKILERAAISQMEMIPQLESEAAIRAIFAGLALQKLRRKAAHGTWEKKLKQMLTSVNIWTPKTAKTNASYYMRLASHFVEKTRVSVPEMLALPGDQTELALDGDSTAQARRMVEKLKKYVGDFSLNELLVRANIKGVERDVEEDNLPPEKQEQAARERLFESLWNANQTVLTALTDDQKAHLVKQFEADKLARLLDQHREIVRRLNDQMRAANHPTS